jgi:hypothetical protein
METPRRSEVTSQKKVYTPPKLERYGNLRSITDHLSNTPPHPDPPFPPGGPYRT